jgi:hypothetical protein
MCFGGGTTVTPPAPPPVPPPPAPPPMPAQPQPAAEQLLINKDAQQGVRPKTSTRQRTAMRQGTSQLRIPLNLGSGGSSGGLNT